MIYIYKFISLILIPFIKINIKIRIKKGLEMPERYKERYGKTEILSNTNKKTIWIHAASIGELKSADFLIKKYHKKYRLLITTTTVSAAKYATDNYKEEIIHQFAPLDIESWVAKFIQNWNPRLVIWIESDLWPTTLYKIKEEGLNAILINLRLSPNSFKRWKLAPFFYNNLLNCFSYVFAQSIIDQKRINKISNKTIEFIGNLKLTRKDYNTKNIEKYNIKNKSEIFTLMLSSTHEDEEIKLLPSLKKLLEEYSSLRIIIAPRHINRSNDIKIQCRKFNLESEIVSDENKKLNKITIINKFGVLQNYFFISDIVFLGGSLINAGGHNPIEPALNKCAILTGPKIFNWENIFNEMTQKNACIKIKSIEDFYFTVKSLINNKDKIEKIKNNDLNFLKNNFTKTDIIDKIIDNYMDEA